jgi:hypothetical protein
MTRHMRLRTRRARGGNGPVPRLLAAQSAVDEIHPMAVPIIVRCPCPIEAGL